MKQLFRWVINCDLAQFGGGVMQRISQKPINGHRYGLVVLSGIDIKNEILEFQVI
jgi:hypothetical protein